MSLPDHRGKGDRTMNEQRSTNPAFIRVIDFETTGFVDDENAEVIELGRVDLDLRTLRIGNAWSALAKPTGPIPPVTMAVHHITDPMVQNCPKASDLWPAFWEGADDSIIVAAHNAEHEQAFVDAGARRWICTYRCAATIWPDAPSHGNQVLRYWLGFDESGDFDPAMASPPHRALPDAYVTAFLMREIMMARPIDELVEISKHPPLLRIMNFGKHKGTAFEDAPSDYLYWIANKSDLKRDVKHTAAHWLRKREGLA